MRHEHNAESKKRHVLSHGMVYNIRNMRETEIQVYLSSLYFGRPYLRCYGIKRLFRVLMRVKTLVSLMLCIVLLLFQHVTKDFEMNSLTKCTTSSTVNSSASIILMAKQDQSFFSGLWEYKLYSFKNIYSTSYGTRTYKTYSRIRSCGENRYSVGLACADFSDTECLVAKYCKKCFYGSCQFGQFRIFLQNLALVFRRSKILLLKSIFT